MNCAGEVSGSGADEVSRGKMGDAAELGSDSSDWEDSGVAVDCNEGYSAVFFGTSGMLMQPQIGTHASSTNAFQPRHTLRLSSIPSSITPNGLFFQFIVQLPERSTSFATASLG
jgi:hypothetical protein